MKNSDVSYRYYDPYDPEQPIRIAFSDRIRKSGYLREVLSYGVHLITEELNIPQYDNVEDTSYGFWIFNGKDEDFKVTWQFDGNKPFSLKIGYYVNNECLDQQVLYEYTTYEEALDFIQNYMTKILTEGVPQEPEVEYNESDVTELKLMHGVMQSMDNEDAYFTWIISGVPDGATEEDYIDIASNPDEFEECRQLFDRLFKRYASDGLFKPSPDEVAYANEVCKRLGLPKIEIYK